MLSQELANPLRQTLLLCACLSLDSKLIFPLYNDSKLSHEVPTNTMFNPPTEFHSVADNTIFDPNSKQATQRHAISRTYILRVCVREVLKGDHSTISYSKSVKKSWMSDGLARLEIGIHFADRMHSLSYISFYFIVVSLSRFKETPFSVCTNVKTVSHVYNTESKGQTARRKEPAP